MHRKILLLTHVCLMCCCTDARGLDGSLDLGFSAELFRDVNASDARAASLVWIRQFMQKLGRTESVKTFLVQSVDDAVLGAEQGRLDAMVLLPTEFLQARRRTELVPFLIPLSNGRPGYEYVVLSRAGLDLQDLGGTRLRVASYHAPQLPLLWLDGVMSDLDLPDAGEWFGDVEQVKKAAAALLPVVFEDAGACIVTRSAFETMSELNPQLAQALNVIATSQLYSPSVICAVPDVYEEFGEILEDRMASMHEEPAGRQVLRLFGVDRLVPFREEYLEPIINLRTGDLSP